MEKVRVEMEGAPLDPYRFQRFIAHFKQGGVFRPLDYGVDDARIGLGPLEFSCLRL